MWMMTLFFIEILQAEISRTLDLRINLYQLANTSINPYMTFGTRVAHIEHQIRLDDIFIVRALIWELNRVPAGGGKLRHTANDEV